MFMFHWEFLIWSIRYMNMDTTYCLGSLIVTLSAWHMVKVYIFLQIDRQIEQEDSVSSSQGLHTWAAFPSVALAVLQ